MTTYNIQDINGEAKARYYKILLCITIGSLLAPQEFFTKISCCSFGRLEIQIDSKFKLMTHRNSGAPHWVRLVRFPPYQIFLIKIIFFYHFIQNMKMSFVFHIKFQIQ